MTDFSVSIYERKTVQIVTNSIIYTDKCPFVFKIMGNDVKSTEKGKK